MRNESVEPGARDRWLDVAASIGLPLTLVGLLTYLAPSVPQHPGFVGVGGLVAVIGAWLLAEMTYRLDRGAFPASLAVLPLPLLGLAFPGADIGLRFPPYWAAVVLGFVGLLFYSVRLVDLAPEPDTGRDTLIGLWRMGGTRESKVRDMAMELDELSLSRRESGRELSDEEWTDQGLVVEWPDETDPLRSVRAGVLAIVIGIAPVVGILLIAGLSSPDGLAALDGALVRIGAAFTALMALPALSVAGRGRWLLIATIVVAAIAFLLVDGDKVLVEVPVAMAVVVALVTVVIGFAVRRPRTLRRLTTRPRLAGRRATRSEDGRGVRAGQPVVPPDRT